MPNGTAPDEPPSRYAATFARGFLMGAADIVPGVSGGTVALVLGIYNRLLTAISRFDAALLKLLAQRHWRTAAEHVDLRFLAALGVGILAGVFSLARLMAYLLEHHREETYAAFFGLILASGILVGRMCRPRSPSASAWCVALGLAGAAAAYTLVSQDALQNRPGLPYTFLCGAVAICAMILPGISGSYLLVMLDKYEEITGVIKDLPSGAVSAGELLTLGVFASGCVVGLLLFSRLLRWLFTRRPAFTMAVLCGFMIGSLKKIWPYQRPADSQDPHGATDAYLPVAFDGRAAACLAIALACFVAVLVADAIARRRAAVNSSDARVAAADGSR